MKSEIARIKKKLVFGEVREQAEEISAALVELFSHLPGGEIDENEPLRFGLDESHKRFVIVRGMDRYWLEHGYTVRERAGVTRYFRNGILFTSPPPSEN